MLIWYNRITNYEYGDYRISSNKVMRWIAKYKCLCSAVAWHKVPSLPVTEFIKAALSRGNLTSQV